MDAGQILRIFRHDGLIKFRRESGNRIISVANLHAQRLTIVLDANPAVVHMRPIFIFLQNRPHFGAQILHLNSLYALRQHFPGRRLIIIGKYPASKLSLELGLADEWQPHKKSGIIRRVWSERPGYIVCFGRRSHFPILLAALIRAKAIAYRSRYFSFLMKIKIDYDERVYRGINYAHLLRTHGIEPLDLPRNPDNQTRDTIFFLPGATGGHSNSLRGHKKWGVDRYHQIFLNLKQAYPQFRYCFVLGPLETNEKQWLENQDIKAEILENADICTLFSEMRRARLVIGNDCGPAHIAHTLRLDMVQLFFGPNPEWFLPRPGATEIHSEDNDINTIAIETVETAARKTLDKQDLPGATLNLTDEVTVSSGPQ